MSSPADSLCSRCSTVHFDFFTNDRPNFQELLPDIFWTRLFPDTCRFCQLLRHCAYPSGAYTRPLRGTLRGVYVGHELQLHIGDGKSNRSLDYSIRHCRNPPLPSPEEKPRLSTSFDVNELGQWLEECEGHNCFPPDSAIQSLPEDFRLIDVKACCIILRSNLSARAHIQYCALSYVWGEGEQPTKLDSSNKDQAEEPGFLNDLDLPKTILDAMALCREINCPYLWVDILCIVQDSDEHKHSQISSMADIYSQSHLAIIATTGNDSNAGLAPYGQRTSSISYLVREISTGSFVASLSSQIAAQSIAKSTWASRGWTLQEYALSRRVLFFAGSYAFLRCKESLRSEDFGLGFSYCIEEERKWDLPLPPFYKRKADPNRHYPSTFSQMLAHFVRRRLSYQEDILDAFTGILTRMEDKELGNGQGIGSNVCGLPSKEFGAALQWTTHLAWPSIPRLGFPSWSWAGWIHDEDSLPPRKGIFHDIYEGFDDKGTNISVLTCYTVDSKRIIHTIEERSSEQILRKLNEEAPKYSSSGGKPGNAEFGTELQRYFTPRSKEEISTYTNDPTHSEKYLSQHVFIWASCATLYVDRPPVAGPHPATLEFPLRLTKYGPQIGAIRLRPEWRKTQPDKMHFFISTAGLYAPSGPSGPLQLKFKLILTQLCREDKLSVYKRIQVSHTPICLADWRCASPKSKYIALV
ncbi:HET-domain-containing protein [Stipitochalara longipes BDJ]|nr:HET-domain-containing protein [Stipitochalara longipes BDJ]